MNKDEIMKTLLNLKTILITKKTALVWKVKNTFKAKPTVRKDGGHYLGISVSWLNTYEHNREILLKQYDKSLKYASTQPGRGVMTCPRCDTETLVSFHESRYHCFTCNYWENK